MHRNLTALLLLTMAIPMAQAEDISKGETLYQANCVSCHTDSVMTRPDRKVNNLKQLNGQVRRCEQALNLAWFDEDINQVADYLNKNYYKFSK